MRYQVTGDNLQVVQIEVQPGEKVYGEAGAMVFMSGNVNMAARVHGGVLSGIKRAATGESFFVTEFTRNGGPGLLGFAGNVPGKIVPLDLRGGKM